MAIQPADTDTRLLSRAVRSLLPAVIVAACGSGCTEPNQYQPPPPPEVVVAKPLIQPVTEYHEETGVTAAIEQAEVRARVRGVLQKVLFKEGAFVQKGEVLYVIEPDEYEAAVQAAEAELAVARVALERSEIEYTRQKKLFAENATAEVNVVKAKAERDAAKAELTAARAALELAKINLERTTVKAPISGRVGRTLVTVGNLVGDKEATLLTTIIRYDPLYVLFQINERALLAMLDSNPNWADLAGKNANAAATPEKERPKLYVQRATDTDYPFEGYIDYVDLKVDETTGTCLIRGVLPNPKGQLLPGLFVRVRVPVEVRERAVLVPEEATAIDQAGRFVLVVNEDEEVERRNVVLGAKQGWLIVVKEGLKGGERVIVKGLQRVRPGVKVTAKEAKLEELEPEALKKS